MANEPSLIIPEIELDQDKKPDWDEMERRLYQNFMVVRETLNAGLTTTFVSGTMKQYFTYGVLTRISTAT